MAAVDRDEIDALEDLKHTNEIITSSLSNDLQLIQARHKNLITDYDQQRNHLVDALLDREILRNDLEAARRGRPTPTLQPVESDADAAEADAAQEESKTALQSLKEVSRELGSPTEKSPTGRRSFQRNMAKAFKIVFSQSKDSHTPKPNHQNVTSDNETLRAAEIAYERQAVGVLEKDPKPDIPPSAIPLPQSPISVRPYPEESYRPRMKPIGLTNETLQQNERQEAIIEDLQRRLKNAEDGGPEAQKVRFLRRRRPISLLSRPFKLFP